MSKNFVLKQGKNMEQSLADALRQSLLEKARENFKIAVEEKTAKIKELVKLQIGKFFMPVFGVNERR